MRKIIISISALVLVTTLGITAVAAVEDGDVVKKRGSSAVFFIQDGCLHPFANRRIFNAWDYKDTDVKIITEEEFKRYRIAGCNDVFARPGKQLVQAVDGATPWNIIDPKIYAVSDDGVLQHITSAEVAQEIFGDNWQELIVPVPLSNFVKYRLGKAIERRAEYTREEHIEHSKSLRTIKRLRQLQQEHRDDKRPRITFPQVNSEVTSSQVVIQGKAKANSQVLAYISTSECISKNYMAIGASRANGEGLFSITVGTSNSRIGDMKVLVAAGEDDLFQKEGCFPSENVSEVVSFKFNPDVPPLQ